MKGHVGANRFRKAAVSATRSARSGGDMIHSDVASLTGHKKSTANCYYYLKDKLQSSDRAAAALPKSMRGILQDQPQLDATKKVNNQKGSMLNKNKEEEWPFPLQNWMSFQHHFRYVDKKFNNILWASCCFFPKGNDKSFQMSHH